MSEFEYRAFLSYRHGGADGAFGQRLHKILESYRVPRDLVGRATASGPVPAKLRPIFRDREDFHAGEGLRDQTLRALRSSEALIVVCSQRAVESPYIAAEIAEFIKLGRGNRIIPIILSGEPNDPVRSLFPSALLADGHEIIAADARLDADGFDLAKLKVIAGLIRVPLDDLRKREAIAQRRRTAAFATATVVFASLSVATAGFAWLADQRRQVAETERARAERNYSVATNAANSLVFDIVQGLRDVEGMRADTVAKILGTAEQSFDKLVQEASNDPGLLRSKAVMLGLFATAYGNVGDSIRQERAARQSIDLIEKLLMDFPEGAKVTARDLALSYKALGDALAEQGRRSEGENAYRDSLTIITKLIDLDPTNTEWQRDISLIHNKLGDLKRVAPDLPGALEAYRMALTIRQTLAQNDKDSSQAKIDLATSHALIAVVLTEQGDTQNAIAAYADSIEILDEIRKNDPSNIIAQHGLSVNFARAADIQLRVGDSSSALQLYYASLDIRRRLVGGDPANKIWQRDLAEICEKIADLQIRQNDRGSALVFLRLALEVRDALVAHDSENAESARFLAATHNKMGELLAAEGNESEARASYNSALATVVKLAQSHPTNIVWQSALAEQQHTTALALASLGLADDALRTANAMLVTTERLTSLNAPSAQLTLAYSHDAIGTAQSAKGNLIDSLAAFRKSLAILETLSKQGVADDKIQRDISVVYEKCGDVLFNQGDKQGATVAYRKSLEVAKKLQKENNDRVDFVSDLAIASIKLASVLAQTKQPKEALVLLTEAREYVVPLAVIFNAPPWTSYLKAIDDAVAKLKTVSR